MFIDSHCHINFPELAEQMPDLLARMRENKVSHALCVSVDLPTLPQVLDIAAQHDNVYASVGVHPDYEDTPEPSVDDLVRLAAHPKVVAIGETGLDYYRLEGRSIEDKPLIIHTRAAAEDTLRLMREEQAGEPAGVMHCFTESWEVAQGALDQNFYISFSGIVTFKSARDLQDVARRVPLERMLIETDSPYLAPVPYRGKLNQPGYVRHVAEFIADLRGEPLQKIADVTTENFFRLFATAKP